MTKWRGTPILALVFAIALVGIATTTENAYAIGFGPPLDCDGLFGQTVNSKAKPVVTLITPGVTSAYIEWTQAELDFHIFGFLHIDCFLPVFFEIELDDTAPVGGPFLFEDEEIPGGASGSYTLEDLECDTTYFFDIDGLWRTSSFGGKHIDGLDHEFTTLSCEEEEDDTNGGGCENCERPSIGVLNTGQRVVTGGLTVNGVTIDADYWATDFDQINVELGEPITFKFVIYDDRLDNIKHVQLQLGKGQIGESFSKIGSATWDRDVMTKKATVTHDDMFTDVGMWRAPDVDCMVDSTECTVIMADVTPTKAIVGNIVFGVNIWDDNGNASQTFFNHGIQVGNQSDVIIVDNSTPIVVKKQLKTDDGLGNVNDRNSEAFKQMSEWNMQQIEKLQSQMGYN